MVDKLKITYVGELDEVLDLDLETALCSSGYKFTGSGYNVNSRTRDLCFANPQQELE